jgi:BirA family transcriptional regulator, biotin operon repressor / biotin---[acetyl-CoA-carboxylase] ligase
MALWSDVRVVAETGSTNADVLALARAGAAEGLVLAAEMQTAGRGRLGRQWISRPGEALTFSVLLRPGTVPQAAWGWVPLLAGVAVVSAVRSVTAVSAALKWPNDVLAGDGKLGGILAERAGDAIVVGIGLNIGADPPVPTATSLRAQGATATDKSALLAAILAGLGDWYCRWRDSAGDAQSSGLHAEYLARCVTIGRVVRVDLPGGASLDGTATGVDSTGRLLVTSAFAGLTAVSAGDVVHVR